MVCWNWEIESMQSTVEIEESGQFFKLMQIKNWEMKFYCRGKRW